MSYNDKDYNFDLFAEKDSKEYTREIPKENILESKIFDEDFILNDDQPHEFKEISSKSRGSKKYKKTKAPKKRGMVRVLIQMGIILTISITLSLSIIFAAVDILALGKDGYPTCPIPLDECDRCETARETQPFVIPQGASTAEIAEILHDYGLINHPLLFRVFARIRGVDGTFQSGTFFFNKNVGYDGIIDLLQRDGEQADQVMVRIPERSNVRGMEHLNIQSIRDILVENGVVTAESFNQAQAHGEFPQFPWFADIPTERLPVRLEGYLFPDTYFFFENQTPQSGRIAIIRMLERLDSVWRELDGDTRAAQLGMSMHEVLTLASIIQMEADGFHDDMPGVSALFHNRLNSPHQYLNFLQSDPTRRYAGEGSAFDTYATPGLPPGPLVSPGQDAIYAALNPDPEMLGAGYYYFVTCTRFQFHYNRTYQAHNATINQLIRDGYWWEWGHRPN